MAEAPRLTRSEDDRMIAGVCGGLAAHYGIDATIVRFGFVLLALFGASGIMLYLALWLIVPRESSVELSPREAVRDSVDEGRRMAKDGAVAVKRGYRRLRGGISDDSGPAGGRPGGDGPTGR
jgi:phage shock protein C